MRSLPYSPFEQADTSDTRLVNEFNLFILEVLKAWTDPAQKHPKTMVRP
jgi:hypothetical protein